MFNRVILTHLRRVALTIALTLTLLWLLSEVLTFTQAAQAQPNDLIVHPGESIQAAIDTANNGDTIFITAGRYTESLTLTKAVSLIGADRDTTILHAVEGQRVLTVTGATISNSVVISGLTFTGGYANNGGGIYSNAPLTVLSSLFISNTAGNGGGLYIIGNANLSDVDFRDNHTAGFGLGGGVYARNGVLNLTRTVFVHNNGSAVYSENSPASIVDSHFERNSGGVGGAVRIDVTGASISHTVFISNTADLGGGGVSIVDGSIVNSRFEGNATQEDWGGGLYAMGTTFVTNTEFISNAAHINGGGAYFRNVKLYNSHFERNTSVEGGAGAFVTGEATVIESRFENNASQSINYAGGIYGYALHITTTQFISNSSGHAGALQAAVADIHNSWFERNTSRGFGGAVAVNDLFMNDSVLISNTAGGGGAVWVPGNATLISNRFENNRASGTNPVVNNGGGLLAEFGAVVISNTEFISNASSQSGGGVSANIADIANSHFEGNTADFGTGGLFAKAVVTLTNVDFISNTGGAVLGGPSTVIGGQFIHNSAQFGGGLGTDQPAFISGTHFIDNSADIGGGLYANYTATVYNARFEANHAITYAGGMFAEKAWIISGATFISNTALKGGGAIVGDLAFMTNTTFIGNSGYGGWGGLVAGSHETLIANSLFERNSGGQVNLNVYNHAHILHTTIASPTVSSDLGINVDFTNDNASADIQDTIIASHTIGINNDDFGKFNGTVTEDYNLFFGNITDTVGIITGTHSLIGDPRFVDPLHDDYHLRFGSPAIDHGIDAGVYTDLDGNPRPIGAGFDIGAYEYQFAPGTVIYLPVIRR